MRRFILAAATLALCGAAFQAAAQPAASQPVTIDRKQITDGAARRMVDACLDYAKRNNLLVGVAVVDISGVLMDFHAMQGGGATLAETAILKAKTAAHWQRSTRSLEQDVVSGSNQAPVWLHDFPRVGALPIIVDGQMAGAIGVGGAAKQDECAQAGIDAVLPKQAAQN